MKQLVNALVFLLVLGVACSKSPKDKAIEAIDRKISQLQKKRDTYQKTIHSGKIEAGGSGELSRKKDLLESRIKRLKETLRLRKAQK